MNFFLPLAISTALTVATSAAAETSKEIGDVPAAPVTYELTEIAGGLETAWSLAFLPSGDMLVTEKSGRLRVIRDDRLLEAPVSGVPDVHYKSQAGLFDVVPHPDFAENGWIYLAYAHADGGKNTLRLARATYAPTAQSGALDDVQVIFEALPLRETSAHYGGKIAFLADGTLLLTNGEGYRYKEKAQALDNHFGKILRLNYDGSIPADNPFLNREGALPEIWSWGHRNPQGLVFDAENDVIYEHEHGPRGGDEVNILKAGANYGWPVITYGIDYSGAIISPFTEREGMEQPVVHYTPSIAASGFALYHGDKFPEWEGDLFVGALAGQHVRRIDVAADGSFGEQTELFTELGKRIRDVRAGPDGFLYVLTDRDDASVYRVSPK